MKFNKLFLFLFLGIFLINFASASFDSSLDTNLVSYYKMDEGAGISGTIIDELGLNNGTNNGATNTTGKIIYGYDFDGNNDYITYSIDEDLSKNNHTINLWASLDTFTGNQVLFEQGTGLTNRFLVFFDDDAYDSEDWIRVYVNGFVGTIHYELTDYNFHMYTVVFNDNNCELYVDGVSKGSTAFTSITRSSDTFDLGRRPSASDYWNGKIDEVGIWNRDLNSTEVEKVWSDEDGLSYNQVTSTPTITLISPLNKTTISDDGANFTLSGNNISETESQWINVTFNVYKNNTIFNSTTVELNNVDLFNETLFIDNFGFSDYTWGGSACFRNSTGDFCINSEENFTLSVSLFTEVSESYENTTVSGTLENFSISIDLLTGYDLLDAKFYYNGTYDYPSISTEDNNRYVLMSDYQIPIISADENITFYWSLTFTGGIVLNSSLKNQYIYAILLDNCSSFTDKLFNITLYDEETGEVLSGDIELIYQVLNVPAYDVINTLSYSSTGKSNTQVCTDLSLYDENVVYSAIIKYSADGYVSKFYNIQRSDIINGGVNLSLYNLENDSSTTFKITYQDSTFNYISGAIVQLQKKFISENLYKTVEAPLTSDDGISTLHIDLDSVLYRATVTKNGEVLDKFDNLVFVCESELTGECELKLLGEINPGNEISISADRDFYYTEPVLSNNSISVSYSIPSGNPATINIILSQKDEFDNKTLCNKTVTSSSGSISCDYSESLGDSYIDYYIYKDGTLLVRKSYLIDGDKSLDWLDNNFILMLVLLLSLVAMSLTSPEWMIMNAIITLVISGAFFLANGLSFVMGLGNLVWIIIAAIILIFKISKQEDR